MIYGIGCDIVEIRRFERVRDSFLNKVYTDKELLLLEGRSHRLAGNFAAKEAVVKALGTGFHSFGARDIEILRSALGAPTVTLYGTALQLFNDNDCDSVYVTISHSKEYAVAYAVIERRG